MIYNKSPAGVKKVLSDAADLIERTGWTRGANARRKDGAAVPWESDSAACFCTSGAITRVTNGDFNLCTLARHTLLSHIGDPDNPLGVTGWNDYTGRTKEEVLAALRAAAAAP